MSARDPAIQPLPEPIGPATVADSQKTELPRSAKPASIPSILVAALHLTAIFNA
jgi:hypothetical protein